VRIGKPAKKVEPNERLAAQAVKGKAMDALKVSGQKPQIKLTLKPPEAKRDKPAPPVVAGKKRPAEETPPAEPKVKKIQQKYKIFRELIFFLFSGCASCETAPRQKDYLKKRRIIKAIKGCGRRHS